MMQVYMVGNRATLGRNLGKHLGTLQDRTVFSQKKSILAGQLFGVPYTCL